MEKTLEKTYSIEPSLIDLNYCLIKSFPFSLPQNVVEDHQLLPSLKHDGYIAQVRMLNSLKRIFEELDIAISSPPNISFKMFKTGQKAKRV